MAGTARILPQEGEPFILTAGNWYLLPADYSFDFSCDDRMEHIYFHLKFCDLDGLDLLSSIPAPIEFPASEDKSALFLSCLASDALADGLLLRHEAESVLLSILDAHNVRLENPRFSPVVVRAIKYIKRNLSAQLTVSEIAEHAFVSTSTLTKKFKAELSKSVSEYVNDRIMFEASQRLLKTNLSVLAISEKYGFSDQFYFSRRFKEKFGLSPMKYRKTTIM
jgi:AraC-like DNA-binding protein